MNTNQEKAKWWWKNSTLFRCAQCKPFFPSNDCMLI